MVSLLLHIPMLDQTDPQYWFDLLKALSNTKDFLERISEGNDDEDVILSAADCIEFEIERIIHRVIGSDVQIPKELNPTVEFEENGTTVELTLGQFNNLHHQSGDGSHIN